MTPTLPSGASILIERPAGLVFSFMATPENDPLWVHGCAAIHRVTAGPIHVGSRLIEQLRAPGIRLRYEWEVTRFEPGHSITYTSRRGLVPMVITLAARPHGGASEVTQDIQMRLPRFVPFGGAIGRLIARREARRNLAALRRRLERAESEGGTVTRPALRSASSAARRS